MNVYLVKIGDFFQTWWIPPKLYQVLYTWAILDVVYFWDMIAITISINYIQFIISLLFLKSAAIIVSSGAKLDLQDSKLFDNGEFGQNLDVSTELATGAIVLEVCTIIPWS